MFQTVTIHETVHPSKWLTVLVVRRRDPLRVALSGGTLGACSVGIGAGAGIGVGVGIGIGIGRVGVVSRLSHWRALLRIRFLQGG